MLNPEKSATDSTDFTDFTDFAAQHNRNQTFSLDVTAGLMMEHGKTRPTNAFHHETVPIEREVAAQIQIPQIREIRGVFDDVLPSARRRSPFAGRRKKPA